MGIGSGVEWTQTIHPDGSITEGATWNLATGCTKKSQGCRGCYAEREVTTRWSLNPKSKFYGRKFTDVRYHPEELATAMRWAKGRRVFICPRSDLFHEEIPFEFIAAAFGAMAVAPQHTYLIPTKRPERARAFFDWLSHEANRVPGSTGPASLCLLQLLKQGLKLPKRVAHVAPDSIPWPLPHVQLGASVENQEAADERLAPMSAIAAQGWNTWVSYEPALGPVDWRPWVKFIRWMVAGGESGETADRPRPSHPAWYRITRDQCRAGAVPYFFKQWGAWHAVTELPDNANFLYRSIKIAQAPEDQARLDEIWGRTCTVDTTSVGFDGTTGHYRMIEHYPSVQVFRIGKHAAPATLDGRMHREYPETTY